MPVYTFRDKKSGEEQTLEMKISERDEFELANPQLEQVFGGSTLAIGDPLKLGVSKNPRMVEFQKYVLPKIAAANPLGNIGKTNFQLKREF